MTDHRWDIVIRGATLFDGTGAAPSVGDLAVRGDRIAAIGEIEGTGAAIEIDAHGLALAPGFIDVHSHDDFAVLTTPAMDFKLMQGVTSEVVGNCGMGAAPYSAVREHFGTFFGDDEYGRRAIRVRFVWSRIERDQARWEQAFSRDEGNSWETNWIMDFTRA